MNRARRGIHVFIATLAWLFVAAQAGHAADVASDSYYQLDMLLETQAAETMRLAELEGEPAIVAMFYASCPHVCPMIISTIGAVEAKLPAAERESLQVLMITLDPERDTPEALTRLAERHRVDTGRWRFARPDPGDVRLIAAALDIGFRNLPDGEFNHTSSMLLLDRAGREIARSGKLGVPDPAFVETVAETLRAE